MEGLPPKISCFHRESLLRRRPARVDGVGEAEHRQMHKRLLLAPRHKTVVPWRHLHCLLGDALLLDPQVLNTILMAVIAAMDGPGIATLHAWLQGCDRFDPHDPSGQDDHGPVMHRDSLEKISAAAIKNCRRVHPESAGARRLADRLTAFYTLR